MLIVKPVDPENRFTFSQEMVFTLSNIFNPVDSLLTDSWVIQVRDITSQEILYQNDLKLSKTKVQFPKSEILYAQANLDFYDSTTVEKFSVYMNLDLSERPPKNTQIVLTFSQNLEYLYYLVSLGLKVL